ncbi:hypothetical protein [Pseudomonas avellanae]|uniref:Uncharacterized protein n=1 Tax=Pseudomonas avellanae TaxID=46257 RepID=A0A3M5TB08_9PSED|nr:hypothetical protein [Pseudomonas avellanae]RMU30773.1 hypothetical protein ALP32_200216 [Pseudomonas avellanae]UQW71925.1 hypothetical protein L2Y00_29430 [Pseudomonas avellanae]GGJ52256.1 hypothetical protein GCM10009085_52080 [Pseudomonas avellanae]
MADYINKSIICQAYLHIDPVPKDLDEAALKAELESFLGVRAEFFLYKDVGTEVELKEGSLKIYLTILGTLYAGIAQYPDFRQGVELFAADSKRVSDYAISESLFLTKSRHDCVLRTEARTGVCGTLKKIADEIDYIKRESGTADPSRLIARMEALKKEIFVFKDNVTDPADKEWVFPQLKQYADEQIPKRAVPKENEFVSAEIASAYIREHGLLMRSMNLEN